MIGQRFARIAPQDATSRKGKAITSIIDDIITDFARGSELTLGCLGNEDNGNRGIAFRYALGRGRGLGLGSEALDVINPRH